MKKATDATPNQRLKEERTLRAWSQKYVAEQIGADHYYLSRWEHGTASPSPYYRQKLCALFGLNAQELGLLRKAEEAHEQAAPATQDQAATTQSARMVLDPAIPPPTAGTGGLVGRDDLLSQLRTRLCGGDNLVLTALNGLPGVGKTSLAVALAHDDVIQQHFRGGILWAAPGPRPNALALLAHWGSVLDVPAAEMAKLTGVEAWTLTLRRLIGTRRMLLVIDDAWTLEAALTFKVGGPACAYIVTTRFPTIAQHFATDGATIVRELSEDEGLTLLARFVPEAVAHESELARGLVRSVGGLPLALTLLGNYLRTQAYSGQPRRIHAAFARLLAAEERLRLSTPQALLERSSSLPIDVPVSLETVISVSETPLDETTIRAFHALAVFPAKPNTFSEEAALAVCQAPVESLDALTDAGLLQGAGPGRYTLHQTIADYASARLTDNAVYERMATYFAGYTEAHAADYAMLETDSINIFTALEIAFTHDYPAVVVRCTNAFARFMQTRGLHVQAELHLQRAYKATRTLHNTPGQIATLCYLGEVIAGENRGNYAQAEAYLQEGLALARAQDDGAWMSRILRPLGLIVLRRGRYAEAEAYLQEGLANARALQDHAQVCALLRTLGSVVWKLGDYERTERYWQEGLALARQIGHPDRMCVLLDSLGCLLGDRGDYVEAERYFQESLTLARQIGYYEDIAMSLSNLGWMASVQGKAEQTEAYFQEALAQARVGENRWLISSTLTEAGEGYLRLGQLDRAASMLEEALTVAPEEEREIRAIALYGLAHTLAARGNPQEARKHGEESLAIFKSVGHYKAAEVEQWLAM